MTIPVAHIAEEYAANQEDKQGLTVNPVDKAIEVLIEKLPQTSKLVEDSALDLSQKFQKLSQSIEQQGTIIDELVETASALTVDGESITMNDFARSFNEAFSSSIERILFISKMSMYMVYSLDDAMKALTAIETFNTKIQSITKQTHLLSLNASIEASRAGREGDGFRIVAHEVKVVSQEIAGLSREMRTKIGLVSSSVRNSYEKLSEVANADMTKNIESREKLDKLLQAMLEQNGRFKDVLDKTAKTSHEISKTIVGTVVGMQFQDRTSQYIHNTVGALSVIGRMIAEQHSFKPEQYEAIADELSRCFLLSEFNNSYAEKLGRKPKQQLVAAASSGTSTDNVELF